MSQQSSSDKTAEAYQVVPPLLRLATFLGFTSFSTLLLLFFLLHF